jgi:hypothetical protein
MKRRIGFWTSLRKLSGEDIFGPELAGAILLGLGGGIALLSQTKVEQRLDIASEFLIVIGPLLGVVFAAFALVIALLAESYLLALSENKDGVAAFFRPFLVAIGIQVGALLLTVAYRAGAQYVPSRVEVGLFLALCFLFVFSLLDVVALGRAVFAHGITRGEEVAVRNLEQKANVLKHRRSGGDR